MYYSVKNDLLENLDVHVSIIQIFQAPNSMESFMETIFTDPLLEYN